MVVVVLAWRTVGGWWLGVLLVGNLTGFAIHREKYTIASTWMTGREVALKA